MDTATTIEGVRDTALAKAVWKTLPKMKVDGSFVATCVPWIFRFSETQSATRRTCTSFYTWFEIFVGCSWWGVSLNVSCFFEHKETLVENIPDPTSVREDARKTQSNRIILVTITSTKHCREFKKNLKNRVRALFHFLYSFPTLRNTF